MARVNHPPLSKLVNEQIARPSPIRQIMKMAERHNIERHLFHTPNLGPEPVVDVGIDADDFVPRALRATGVLVLPGRGFGPSLENGVVCRMGHLCWG